jgi:hypothetical protein
VVALNDDVEVLDGLRIGNIVEKDLASRQAAGHWTRLALAILSRDVGGADAYLGIALDRVCPGVLKDGM